MNIKKNISILGSTGSIGTQCLEIVDDNDDLNVVALSAGSNVTLLCEQAVKYKPEIVCIYDDSKVTDVKDKLKDTDIKVVSGMDGLIEIATVESADVVLTSVVGMIGIKPTIAAINAGKDIALANKETLVCAGHIIMPLARKKGVKILPVDSEHSAIFQSLNGESNEKIDKILLTASGGPFRGYTREQMKNVTLADALNHPNWSMGKKITIDSSTMVNKGLEVMEARWLFDVSIDDIEVVIQPQSLIHSMVQYVDGAIIAQLGTPDMRLPIQYALFYPERRFLKGDRVDFKTLKSITFDTPDLDNFKGLYLALAAARRGGNIPTAFNAANELAVSKFLNEEIKYLEIVDLIEYVMNNIEFIDNPDVDQILDTEKKAYELINEKLDNNRK
ncbi:1-deoxy-D-xylulose 5-phosphate reductoisomerase [Eubacterium uniforme]|uniref:1-deoxy-D-xylulose 5-phosphate reductoisomerase n=1 Tax=Eubacterium uniforme TaxID=39495 RepID=A0A1T4V8G9_9FIRM|nr:1-deoxy-D-xylulose-5-phosphate reductoisomerase [Eubacterium uniforme]SKA61203.1 1-deoxy-D-xylulose 5-phosphate reductoisomerase [Eubacterium uniforme]HAV91113.1 1-deoxy-D-xylulose-5-phosphate reductoisomerase [Eubacterium sp.]